MGEWRVDIKKKGQLKIKLNTAECLSTQKICVCVKDDTCSPSVS